MLELSISLGNGGGVEVAKGFELMIDLAAALRLDDSSLADSGVRRSGTRWWHVPEPSLRGVNVDYVGAGSRTRFDVAPAQIPPAT